MAYRIPIQRVQLVRESNLSTERVPTIRDDCDSADLARKLIGDPDRENFILLGLNVKGRVIGAHVVSIGAESARSTSLGCILRPVLLMGAVSFVLAHNHPGGDPAPSREDVTLTHRVRDAARVLGVSLLDHVIVATDVDGMDSHFSFHASGMLEK